MIAEAQSRTRTRRVFGRRTETINGTTYCFEQREHGLFVKKRYARAWHKISFTDLLAVADGQAFMRF